MPKNVFPYPGGKSQHVNWILSHLPDHECYVEPFGGGAAVLLNKPRSHVEVYNDADSTVATFFKVLRDRTDELIEWLQHTPYSREIHESLNAKLYGHDEPESELEAAGAFYYLRYTSFAGGRDKAFKITQKQPSGAWRRFERSYSDARESLEAFASRFDDVVIENGDYADIIDRYDSDETVFYCDPPYVGTEGYYAGDFNHRRFVDRLHDVDGKWLVSYTDLPPGLEDYRVSEKTAHHSGGNSNGQNKVTERLVANFDVDGETLMTDYGQSGLDAFAD